MAADVSSNIMIFILAVFLVIIAQFWYDAILEIFKAVLKRKPLWYDYLISSIIATIIFLLLLIFVFKVSVSSII